MAPYNDDTLTSNPPDVRESGALSSETPNKGNRKMQKHSLKNQSVEYEPHATGSSNAADEPVNTAPAAPPFKSKRKKALFGIVLAFALAGVIGFCWWLFASQYESTDNATLVGNMHPVSSRVAGTIQEVLVSDNQTVKKGELLAVIDSRDYDIALSQAEHQLKSMESQAETARKSITLSERQAISQITQARGDIGSSQSGIRQSQQAVKEMQAGIEGARQQVRQQEANYQKALADYNRYTGADPEAVSAQQIDVAKTNLSVAEAARNSAKSSLLQAQARYGQMQSAIGSSVSKLTQAKGVYQGAQAQQLQVSVTRSQYQNALDQVEIAKDAVRQAKLNLSYTRVVAPADGRVGRKSLEIGQRVQPGEPLMSLVSPEIWVVANFKETQLERMRPGQPVEIEVDAFPNHPLTGKVQSFSPASGAQFALLPPENATGNFTKIVQRIPVKILIDPQSIRGYETLLVPGMSTEVKVHVTSPEG